MSAWVLVVAGHDPSGGAGVDADREALAAAGADARAVVATSTEQDGVRVRAFAARPLNAWLAEARSLVRELGAPRVLKVGLVVDADHVRALARLVGELGVAWCVVDPVLAASGGERFVGDATRRALLDELVPAGVVLTPNVPEVAELAGSDPDRLARAPAAREAAARALLARGARAVIVKGGHGGEDPVIDLVVEAGRAAARCAHARVAGASLHGSGCRFASFTAGRLALGDPLEAAVSAAGAYLAARIAAGATGGRAPLHARAAPSPRP